MNETQSMGIAGSTLEIREAVKALILTDDAVLLIKQRHADGTPFWTLPGEGVQVGESCDDALRRELREELDCHVYVGDAVDTIWYAHRSDAACVSVYTVYQCQIDSQPTSITKEGICEYRWVALDALPAGTLPQVRLVCSRRLPSPSPILQRR
jgi:8-oxo-dGTP diphosphatase